MATLNLFPARIRFTNTDGTLTPEAYRALQVLFERVGGALGDNGRDVFGDITGVAALDLSIMDTVTQPTESKALTDMVQQSVSVAAFVPDVVQSPICGASFMPDVVQPVNEAAKASDMAADIHAATSKTPPVDADELPLADGASGFTLKKLTWANLKATLATWIASNAIEASFTTLNSSGLATLGTSSGGKQISGRDHTYAGSLTWFSTVGDGAERIRFGHYDSGSVAFPSGMVPAQIMAGVSGLHISTRDTAGAVVNLRAGSGVPVVATVSASGLTVVTGNLFTLGGATMHTTTTALTNGSGSAAGTLGNAPVAGNPTKWIGINDNGTVRYIPSW